MTTQAPKIKLFHSIKGQLLIFFLAVSIVPLFLVGMVLYFQANDALRTEAHEKLVVVRDIKAEQIEDYFEQTLFDVNALARDRLIITEMRNFNRMLTGFASYDWTPAMVMEEVRPLYLGQPDLLRSFEPAEFIDPGSNRASIGLYHADHARLHSQLQAYVTNEGYRDIFLVEPGGVIIYSVLKTDLFGADLKAEPYEDTNLAYVFEQALAADSPDFALLGDITTPEAAITGLFVASPLFDADEVIGVLVFQLDIGQINAIMQERSGLGQTGKAYLVGADRLMRSDAPLAEQSTVFSQPVNTEAVTQALAGHNDVGPGVGYNGSPVLAAYKKLNITGVEWAIIAQIDRAEAFALARRTLAITLVSTGLAALAVTVLALVISSRITGPLAELTASVQTVFAGGADRVSTVSVPGDGRDNEVGILTRAFNQMARKLNESFELLEERVRARTARLETVATLSGQLNAILEVDHLLQELVNQVKERFGYYHVHVYLLNETGDSLDLIESYGQAGAEMKAAGHTIALDHPTSLTARAARQGQPLILDDVHNEPGWQPPAPLPDVQSKIAVPIIQESRTVGVLTVYSGQKAGLDEADADLLQSLANQVAVAMTNAGLFARVEAALQETQMLFEAAGAILGETEIPQICHHLLEQAMRLVEADRMTVFLIDHQQQDVLFKLGAGNVGPSLDVNYEELTEGISGQVLQSGRSVLSPHPEDGLEPAETRARRYQDDAGTIMVVPLVTKGQVVGTITAINRLEQADFDSHDVDLLTAVARQATAAIENARLLEQTRQARTEAEEARVAADQASQAKSDFLSSMSHELRTPLNGILGYAQILRRSPDLTPGQKEGLNIIHQSGEHLLTLINDILDLSKIEAGKLVLYPKDFNLADFLASVSGIIRIRAQNQRVDFALDDAQPLPDAIHGDEKRLRQVLINLLNNAVKFTDEGGVTLRVTPVARGKLSTLGDQVAQPLPGDREQEGVRLRFEVMDTGVGITEAELEKIFQPFEQVGNVNKRSQGTGLGLSITQRLLELMGSSLQVESQPGQGSTFWFEVLLPEVEAVAAVVEEKETAQEIIGYEGARKTVLVVDDKAHNRAVMLNILTPLGFKMLQAEGGQAGIELALETRPDLVIMDMIMPGMTGFEAVQKMREIPEFEKTVILGASASVFEEDRQRVKLAGCDAFIAKPVEVKKLLDTLAEHLGLEWVYKKEAADEIEPEPSEAPKIVPPPAEALAELYQLARRGNMRKIRQWADRLMEQEEQYWPFAHQVQELARRFQKKEILALVEQYLPQEE